MVSNYESVDKVTLVGLVGNDPEVKYTASGSLVGRFSLATAERFKDKSGKFQDRTERHNIVVWQKLAVGEFVSKGSHLYIVLLGSRERGNGAQPAVSGKTEKGKPTAEQLALLRSRTMIFRFDSAL